MAKTRLVAALVVLTMAVALPAAGDYSPFGCKECRQICWGFPLGCEYFCTLAETDGYTRCYDSVSHCQQFERCRIIIV